MTTGDTKVDNELLHEAWGVIANASDWHQKHDHPGDERRRREWVEAAERWRDKFHETLTTTEERAS